MLLFTTPAAALTENVSMLERAADALRGLVSKNWQAHRQIERTHDKLTAYRYTGRLVRVPRDLRPLVAGLDALRDLQQPVTYAGVTIAELTDIFDAMNNTIHRLAHGYRDLLFA